jgi:hypothetical protein
MATRKHFMRRYAFIPSSPDPLEGRFTPSHLGLAVAAPTSPAITQSQDLKLYGFALGHETTRGIVHLWRASDATISPLGKVSLTGFLVIPNKHGANRPVQGTVTILSAHGTITASLKGTVTVFNGSFSFASGNLTYTIVSSTKADRGVTGAGPVLYGPGPVLLPGRFLLDFGNFPPPP